MEERLTVAEDITQGLAGIADKKRVLTDEATLEQYGRDESWEVPKRPDWVVKVKDTAEVQKIVQFANQQKVPVVPRSSGVGFYGSGIPG